MKWLNLLSRKFITGVILWVLVFLCILAEVPQAPSDVDINPFQSIKEMEKTAKRLVNAGIKMALPFMMSTITEIKLSSDCARGLVKLMRGMMDIQDWAMKMVDALGKPSAGMLEGTATALGDYDECLDIVVPKNSRTASLPPYPKGQEAYHGQYCMIQINIPEALRQAAIDYQVGNRSHSELANTKTFLRSLVKIAPRADIADLRLGVCIPSTCQKNDLQAIVNEITKQIRIKATALRCETKSEKWLKTEQIVILVIFGLIIALVMVGTASETILRFMAAEPVDEIVFQKQKLWVQFLLSFSLYNNCKKLMKMGTANPEAIGCIRGMRFISVCLYVVVSTYATPHDFHFLKYRSAFHFYKFMEEWWFTVFANASAGVDTLFFIAGLQITYGIWKKSAQNSEERVNINIPRFIIKWYLRFTCAQLLVIGLFLCLPLIGNGPIWEDVVGTEVDNCRKRWWMNILYVNNFWSSNGTCLTHSWIVTTLMHLLILTSVILWILSKWTAVGILVNIVLIAGTSVAIALVTLLNDLPPAPAFYFLSFLNLNLIWDRLFVQAYDHTAPFCLGILLGYYMARHSKVKLKRVYVIIGWCAMILCNMTVLCGLYGYRHGEPMEIGLSAVYAAVHRIAWSLGIAWFIFACVNGYGGVVNEVLSWRIFIPLDRLSNLTYLLHPLILYLHGGQIREKMYMAHLDQAMYATAYIVITVAFAGLCYVSCRAPFAFIESKIYGLSKKEDATNTTKKAYPRKGKETRMNSVTSISILPLYEEKEYESSVENPKIGFDNATFST